MYIIIYSMFLKKKKLFIRLFKKNMIFQVFNWGLNIEYNLFSLSIYIYITQLGEASTWYVLKTLGVLYYLVEMDKKYQRKCMVGVYMRFNYFVLD